MEMIKVSGGKLQAIGYDPVSRTLQQVAFSDGRVMRYAAVSQEAFPRLKTAGRSLWSFFRDDIEDEYSAGRVK